MDSRDTSNSSVKLGLCEENLIGKSVLCFLYPPNHLGWDFTVRFEWEGAIQWCNT